MIKVLISHPVIIISLQYSVESILLVLLVSLEDLIQVGSDPLDEVKSVIEADSVLHEDHLNQKLLLNVFGSLKLWQKLTKLLVAVPFVGEDIHDALDVFGPRGLLNLLALILRDRVS